MSKSKTKRILLGILLAGSITNVAHADEQTVYTFDDYTEKISATDATYTYTDAEGTVHEVAYKTVDMDSITPDTKSVTVQTDFSGGEGNQNYSPDPVTVEINGQEVEFNVTYNYDESQVRSEVINNSGEITDTITGVFNGLKDSVSGSDEYGGAIYNTGSIGTITAAFINDGDETGSATNEYGGAIYNTGSIGSINGSYFLGDVLTGNDGGNNNLEEGASIYNGQGGSIGSITNSNFIGNHIYINATSAGNETDYACGSVIYNNGTIGTDTDTGISGSYFVGNSIEINHTGTGSETDNALGGVIDNDTYGRIYSINSSYFIGNKISATNTGGTENDTLEGGVIFNRGIIDSISGSYFIGNSVSSETGVASGGAIYNSGNSTTVDDASIGTITGSYFIENSATNGGAIWNNSGGAISTITESYFLDNTADGGNGGAIYIYHSPVGGITKSYFSGNSATNGGAIYNGSGAVSSLEESYFVGNTATESGGAIYSSSGGITAYGGNVFGDIENSYFINNTAATGGAISNSSRDVADGTNYGTEMGSIKESYFIGNTATGGSGGAIYNYADGSTTYGTTIGDITDSYFIENTATIESGDAMGGAINNSANATIGSLAGTSFIGNYAESEEGTAMGGAIYNAGTMGSSGVLTVGDLINNHATGTTGAQGGAIYDTVNATVEVTGSVAGNYVKTTSGDVAGGVIYLDQEEGTATTISVKGDVVENHAETASGSAKGGAFYNNEAGTLTIGGDILGNYVSAAGGNAYGGAIYNEGTLNISESGPDLIGNYAVSTDGEAAGGAIYNASETTTGEGTLTLGDVIGNYAEGATGAKGGAIYDAVNANISITGNVSQNHVEVTGTGNVEGGVLYLEQAASGETTVSVTGDVTGNYAKTASGTAYGGAFYNNGNGTLSIGGDISDNYVSGTEGAKGGAIYNEGTLTISGTTISGNYATATEGNAAGGAIYNEGSIGTIEGAFTGNYASTSGSSGNAAGGAIYNSSMGSIESITATALSSNYAESESSYAEGGAIDNENSGTAITVTGDITDNYVKAATNAAGGAILSMGDVTVTGAITGNYAEGKTGAYGGAILNTEGTLTVTATSIANNYAKSESGNAMGGAIYNEVAGSSITVTGDVKGNYADASATAAGGAIYNAAGGTVTINGNITGNYAKGGTAQGGAIYNAAGGTVNINIENKDAVISGNYTESGGTKEANVLYGEAGSVTNFNLTDASLTLEDSLTGDTGFEVNVKGNGTDATTFYMLNDILDSNLSFDSTTINTINNEVHAYSVNSLSINGDVNFVADVDLANESMDRFTASEYGSHAGNLNVSGMNLISDTENDSVEIPFAEAGLKDNVTSSVGTLPDSNNQQKAYTPLYEYNVAYDNRDDAGYFTFDKTGNNPSADVPEEAEAAAISFMNLMYRYAFEHSDYYMKLPRNVRQAIIKGENCAEDENCLENYRAYNGHNLTDPGIWVKPFASNETVPFGHQFTARTKNYGLLVGVDTAFKEKGRWANVFTGYVGYDGIRQTFSGNSTEQYGGLLGVTDTVYNGNFFAAVTLSGGDNVLKAKTMYGREKTHLYMGGAAVKTGYNMEFAGGNYSFLPTFMASYTYANIKDYTSASGLKMDSNGMHAVELNPNFKFIRNLNSGWMPYATVGEIWTVGQHSDVRASGTLLDELTFRPYTEYGLGVQKMWSKGYDGYAEFLGHAGGRRGFLINLGFRWAFN